ncbi:MAG: hypothetical protein A2W31_13910 [Planctomycetes bacterium RBG_16_64_10]|nr:MAG: hypothetical protein A2W31_13910 [Planctomycetes bacterium RBG_16_64_10]
MGRIANYWLHAVLLAGPCAQVAWATAGADEMATVADWHPPSATTVRRDVLAWLANERVDESTRAQAAAWWATVDDTATAQDNLQRLAATFALVRPDVHQLQQHCARPDARPAMDQFRFLTDPQSAPLLRHNMGLVYGRWLAQHEFYDEAQRLIGNLQPADVVDPATLLFYQSVIHHRLVQLAAGQRTLAALLQRQDELPRRYRYLAQRMQRDLLSVQEDSLDHIARRMDDIERRLHLGHATREVRQIEDQVVASLDRLIKQLEDQAQQRQAGSSSSSDSRPASNPAADSRILTGQGAGEVDRKAIGHSADWGNLPPKRREEALQQIGQQFPSHYREVVEQYFKRLAREQQSD